MTTKKEFLDALTAATLRFPQNAACKRIVAGTFTGQDYHRVLVALFHQAREAPVLTALAASQLPGRQMAVRDAMLSICHETRDHWRLLLSDLEATGYRGVHPADQFPPRATQAYVAYNHYLAVRQPLARLGVSVMLAQVGTSFARNYAHKLLTLIGLKPTDARFLFSHSDRTENGGGLLAVLDQAQPRPDDWAWLAQAVATAGWLYTEIYNEALG